MLKDLKVKNHKQIIEVGDVKIGGDELVIMAGPCAVESREQILEAAEHVKANGGQILRGGAFKPRTSPYSFQGLGEEGLKLLAEARERTGLKIITEVLDSEDLELVDNYADILQIGSRNMQNYGLLKKLGKVDTPVMLKRGYAATVKEWLLSAEYVISHGNPNVILCERGIRTFETATRNTLDLNAIALVKELTDLPVIIDPSHGTGKRSLVNPLAKAGISVGADGIIVEVHPNPEEALCDGEQSLTPNDFTSLIDDLDKVAKAVDKRLII
ncbi:MULTISPECIES: 3-deoxy-7-phosphoheptulonate synthase [unclassified Candidatus Frackibacter]|uniref:3-deoxy-7-phosphoheptulonate synthase n=1 Tax=unclassified Candidatus Frackibacter TaxID=2648818 RepID=UPI0008914F07|nr:MULTISPECIES: 3-deoxy-7-phosphoheptulonate synthase [unclassified Candidatus Frackibacter]SDC17807.1 3-deoxy-D-arabinoheptulosonate-7-phosphate synthase [Candidatus Frackibacter sp. WG11]SEM44204.1 3-deoxy-D-arabinoheptulosonate-7-phosphate synthase [Candidatus Frackibacter sp. WG12]SFL46737.1 3-deoxy-D-arabinoheptulosonate-7-phosphate synthase [Candidatus Frackibacter sp. WG13]